MLCLTKEVRYISDGSEADIFQKIVAKLISFENGRGLSFQNDKCLTDRIMTGCSYLWNHLQSLLGDQSKSKRHRVPVVLPHLFLARYSWHAAVDCLSISQTIELLEMGYNRPTFNLSVLYRAISRHSGLQLYRAL